MRHISSWTSVALLLSLACHDQGPSSSPIQKLVAISGNAQSAAALDSLPLPLTIEVQRADGSTASGVAVQWSITTGDGTLDAAAPPSVGATTKTVTTQSSTDGRASVYWRLGPTSGMQQVTAQIVETPSVQITLTGSAMGVLVMISDGAHWKTQLADSTGDLRSLRGLWGTSATSVAAVGQCGTGNSLYLVLKFDGLNWQGGAIPVSFPNTVPPRSSSGCSFDPGTPYSSRPMAIGGRSITDLFVLGVTRSSNVWSRIAQEGAGSSWNTFLSGDTYNPPGYKSPNGIWFGSGSVLYVVSGAPDRTTPTPSGVIERYDGSSWSVVYPAGGKFNGIDMDPAKGFLAIWGTSESDLTVVGRPGTILHFDGSNWTSQSSPTTAFLRSVHGLSSTNMMAVGDSGTILHYDGSSWSRQSSGTTVDLYSVQMVNPVLAYAVGDSGVVVRYDGSTWTPSTPNRSVDLRGVWAANPNAVFAVGAPRR